MILIGKHATVTDATNKAVIGLAGEIVADNRDTITLRKTDGELKLLVKHTITLEVEGRTIPGATTRGTHAARLKR
jgi:RNase P/RNase MRP subunit p29